MTELRGALYFVLDERKQSFVQLCPTFCLKRSMLNESVSRTRQLWQILHRRQKNKCPQHLRPFPKFRLEPLPQHLRPWYQWYNLRYTAAEYVPWHEQITISCFEIYWDIKNSCKTQIYSECIQTAPNTAKYMYLDMQQIPISAANKNNCPSPSSQACHCNRIMLPYTKTFKDKK